MFDTGFVVHHTSSVLRNFKEQASIYVDACFLLTMIDKNNPYRDTVLDLVEEWGAKGIVIGISNHVFHEVTNILLKNGVHHTIELAFLKYNSSRFYSQKWNRLDATIQAGLGEETIARRLLESAEKLYPGKIKRRHDGNHEVYLNVQEILKDVKKTLHDRSLLQTYYRVAKGTFDGIIHRLQQLDLKIEYLESDEDVLDTAKAYMELFQLEPTDALHLAITRCNYYDYLVTLDGDFVHNLYTTDEMHATKIYKIGA